MSGEWLALGVMGALALAGTARRGSRAMADTNTDVFRRWFGDSVVVDDRGKPLVVYHGTDADEPIEAFDPSRIGDANPGGIKGFFFASRPATADAYRPDDYQIRSDLAEEWAELLRKEKAAEQKLVAVFNTHFDTTWPIDTPEYQLKDAKGKHVMPWDLPAPVEQAHDALDQIKKTIYSVYEDRERERPRYWTKTKGGQRIAAYLSLQNPLVLDTQGAAWSRDFDNRLRAVLRQQGVMLYDDHDGLILRNFYDGETGLRDDIYVAFRPEQIKSIDNRGTFDPADPRISFNTDADRERQIRLQVARDYPEKRLSNLHRSGVIPRSYLERIKGFRPGQARVTIYRGVPPGVTEIRPGDWVGLNRAYAALHDRGGGVISKRVPASEVMWAGTDLNEWFYTPSIGSRATWTPGPSKTLVGWRAMRYDPARNQAISGANSRIRLPVRAGEHTMPGLGIFLAPHPKYVLDHYADHDHTVLLKYAFDPAAIRFGNLTDRQAEIAVPRARLLKWWSWSEDEAPPSIAQLQSIE